MSSDPHSNFLTCMHNLNVFSVSYTYNRIHPCVMFLRHIPSARLCIVYKRETFTISMLEVLVQIYGGVMVGRALRPASQFALGVAICAQAELAQDRT